MVETGPVAGKAPFINQDDVDVLREELRSGALLRLYELMKPMLETESGQGDLLRVFSHCNIAMPICDEGVLDCSLLSTLDVQRMEMSLIAFDGGTGSFEAEEEGSESVAVDAPAPADVVHPTVPTAAAVVAVVVARKHRKLKKRALTDQQVADNTLFDTTKAEEKRLKKEEADAAKEKKRETAKVEKGKKKEEDVAARAVAKRVEEADARLRRLEVVEAARDGAREGNMFGAVQSGIRVGGSGAGGSAVVVADVATPVAAAVGSIVPTEDGHGFGRVSDVIDVVQGGTIEPLINDASLDPLINDASPDPFAGVAAELASATDAAEARIRRTYHAQALKCHPDCGGSAKEFAALRAQLERALRSIGRGNFASAEGRMAVLPEIMLVLEGDVVCREEVVVDGEEEEVEADGYEEVVVDGEEEEVEADGYDGHNRAGSSKKTATKRVRKKVEAKGAKRERLLRSAPAGNIELSPTASSAFVHASPTAFGASGYQTSSSSPPTIVCSAVASLPKEGDAVWIEYGNTVFTRRDPDKVLAFMAAVYPPKGQLLCLCIDEVGALVKKPLTQLDHTEQQADWDRALLEAGTDSVRKFIRAQTFGGVRAPKRGQVSKKAVTTTPRRRKRRTSEEEDKSEELVDLELEASPVVKRRVASTPVPSQAPTPPLATRQEWRDEEVVVAGLPRPNVPEKRERDVQVIAADPLEHFGAHSGGGGMVGGTVAQLAFLVGQLTSENNTLKKSKRKAKEEKRAGMTRDLLAKFN